MRVYRAKNRDRINEQNRARRRDGGESVRQKKKHYLDTTIARWMYYRAKERANRLGIDLDIDIDDVTVPALCPVLGIEIARTRGQPGAGSPSIDRINPMLGYVKGNVRVISWRANRLKSDASPNEIYLLYEDSLRVAAT